MAIFKGGKGRDDTFVGGTKADRFEFDPLDLNGGDMIVGGSGRAIDVLRFTAAGTIDAAAFANISGIERIELADGGNNSLTLTNALAMSATNQRIVVIAGASDDVVDASGLTASAAVDVLSGSGDDVLTGGDGADSFGFSIAELSRRDLISGGGGIDRLRLLDGGLLTADKLSGVRSIEAINFSNQATKLVLDAAIFTGSSSGTLTVYGGAGNDEIDARGASGAPVRPGSLLQFFGGDGDDIIIGSLPPQDTWSYSSNFVDGGAGRDTIDIKAQSASRVVFDPNDVHAFVATGTLLVVGAATIDLTKARDQSLGDECVTRGFIGVDASGSQDAVVLTGTGTGTLIGGAGNDTISDASAIRGGAGADTMIGTKDFNGTSFSVKEGDFAAGEKILGQTGNDKLDIRGSADLSRGEMTGIRYMTMDRGDSGKANTVTVFDNEIRDLFYLSGTGTLLIKVDADHETRVNGLTNFGSPDLVIAIEGTRGADTITSGTSATVHGGGGSDTIQSFGTVFGDGGDDRLIFSGYGGAATKLIDGGDGSDTLVANDYVLGPLRLDQADQSLNDNTLVRNIENVDYTKAFSALDCVGSASANTLIGSSENDSISGGDGDDTIVGGSGNDRVTGGAGVDRFVWTGRSGTDTITDFTAGQDTLVFARKDAQGATVYDFAGAKFDTMVVADSNSANLRDADLVIDTAGKLNSLNDVASFLRGNATGSIGEGIFIVGTNDADHSVLYYVSDASMRSATLSAVADLGSALPTNLTLSDFAFI